MAEAADAPAKGGALGVLTRKVGPLPLFVWVLAAALAFYLYRRSHPASSTSSSTGSTGTAPTDQTTYVPGFDAATSGGGGIGSTATPGTVNNYYYGDTAAAQATGGGTSSGDPSGSLPGGTFVGQPVTAPISTPGAPSSHPPIPAGGGGTPGGGGFPTVPITGSYRPIPAPGHAVAY